MPHSPAAAPATPDGTGATAGSVAAPARDGAARRHRGRRPVVLLAVLIALVALVGTGCVRVRAGVAVSTDDLVSGQIDIGTPDGSPDGGGPPLVIPEDLTDVVAIARYEQDGYVGSRVTFSDLTLDEASRVLPAISPTTTSAVRLQLRRVGDRVVLSGQVDLTRVAPESADVQLKMAFPGTIRQTDGAVSQGVISWTFQPGSVGEVNAVAEYDDPNAPSWISWALLLLGIVAVAAALVVVLAAAERPAAAGRARR